MTPDYSIDIPDEDEQFHCLNNSCSFDFSPMMYGKSQRLVNLSKGSASLENGYFKCPVCNTVYEVKYVMLMDQSRRLVSSLFLNHPKPLKWGMQVAAS